MQTINNNLPSNKKSAESILQQANPRLFPLIMNNVPQALFWKDRNLVYLGCNQAFATDAGLSSPDDVIGKTDFDMPWKDQAELYRADDLLVMKSGAPKLDYEEPQTTPTGSTSWLRTSKIPVEDHGEIVAILGMYEDITERKQAEQALRDSEARYSAVVTQATDGVVIIQNNILQFVNEALANMLGYAVSEIEKTAIINYIAPESKELIVNRIKARLAGQEVPSMYEAKLQRKDGTLIDAELSAGLIEFGGKPADLGIIRDVTKRKQAEQALSESEERFRRFSEATTEGLIFHEQGTVIDVNPAAVAMIGASDVKEFIGRNLLEYIVPELHQLVLESMQSESVLPYEIRCIHRNGYTFPVETSTRAYRFGNRVIRASSMRDITERKKLEQEIQTAFERRGRQVQISTQVAQAIAAATSLEDLYHRVVTQVKEQFGYYHTQLFRYDSVQDAVVLVRGYGETGETMLAAGHHLPMGKGLIGTAAETGETMLRPTLQNDADWQPHPLLPDTKGEIAVPIKLGEIILGVLDVQSNDADALNTDDKLLLEGLCGQIAVAIESTRLSEEMAERLKEINRLYQAMSREGWQSYWQTTDIPLGFMYDQGGLREVQGISSAEDLFVDVPLAVPGGEVIGKLAIADDPGHPLSDEDKDFVQQVSEQVALALESARLFEQTQSALASTQESEAKLSEALDIAKLAHWEYDLEKGKFIFNDQFYSMFHITAEQVGGYELSGEQYAQFFVHPEDAHLVNQEIAKGLASTDLHFSANLEHRMLYADGGMGYMSVEVHIERDESGNITRWYGANQDITERRTAQEAIAKRAQDLAAVSEISSASTKELDLQKLLATVVHLTQRKFGLYHAHVFTFDEKTGDLQIEACGWKEGEEHEGAHRENKISLSQEQSLVARAARTRKAVIVNDVHNEPGWLPNPFLPDTQSEMAVPLILGDQLLGVLDVQSDKLNAFSQEDASIQTTLAAQIATSIQNARSFEQTQEALNWQQTINHTNIMIGQARTVEEIVRGAAELLPLLGMLSCSVSLVTELDSNGVPTLSDIHIVRFIDNKFVHMPPVLGQPTAGWLPDEPKYYQENRVTVFPSLEDLSTIVPSTAYKAEGAVAYMRKVGMRSAIALALGARNKAIGYLTFTSPVPLTHIPERYIAWLAGMVDLISAAIDNQQLLEETKRGQEELNKRAQDLTAVSEISSASTKELNIQKLLETVVHLTQRKFGLYHAHVFIYNEQTDILKVTACGWKEGDEHEGTHGTAEIPLAREQSVVARAARTHKPIIVNDVHNEPGWLANPLLPDTQSEMAVPMFIGDQLLGVLDVQSDKLNFFSEEDASIQTALASQIATALQNARSFEQAQRQAQRESMLNAIGQKIQSATTVEAVLQIAARELGRALSAPLTVAQLGVGTKTDGNNGN